MSIIINDKPATDLSTADFDYFLPEEQIAQLPLEPRDSSRLMVIDRESGDISHKHFYDIVDHLREGDTLVINDSRVIPARLYGHAEGRPEAAVELLLLRQRGDNGSYRGGPDSRVRWIPSLLPCIRSSRGSEFLCRRYEP